MVYFYPLSQMEAMVQARRCGVETLTREQEALLHSELQVPHIMDSSS